MKKEYFLLIIGLIFLTSQNIIANNEVGAELTYEYLGAGSLPNSSHYRFTLSRYRDCSSFTLPQQFSLRIFQNGVQFQNGTIAQLDTIIQIENPTFPCQIVSDTICLFKGIYNLEVDLPISDTSYFIGYQSCCRLDSVTNIKLGMWPWGFSTFVELTPLAQQSGNSSPTFVNFPPTLFCKDKVLPVSINAEDSDGDQLIYEFYNSSDWTAVYDTLLNWVTVMPHIPPPYPLIPFDFPNYHYTYPFGLTAHHDFNPVTGELEIIPDQVGNYTIGFQVSEFRNGQLLSTVYRDFLVKVVDCEPQVTAHLAADTIDAAGNYIFNLCNENTLALDNQSTHIEYIQDYRWTFDLNNTTVTDTSWQPVVNFPEAGVFAGQLILNPDGICSDTANLVVQVTTELQPDFQIDYDTCVGGPVHFYNTSASNGGDIQTYHWQLGDGESSDLVNPIHQYATPQLYDVQLRITNEHGCRDSLTRSFLWQPAPPVVIIAPSAQEGCSPLAVHFENQSTPVDSTYQVVWEMGDGGSVEAISPAYSYADTGVYSVYVAITSPIGCFIDTVFSDLIRVVPPPQVDFSWTPEVVSNFQNEVTFQNESTGNLQNFWWINQDIPLFGESPKYAFDEPGTYDIQLKITNEYGCMDSLTQQLTVAEGHTYYLPNAFTPNEDGRNEVFKGKGIFTGITDFEMSIWNRYGDRIFSTDDIQKGWNGRRFNTGKLLAQGVYICQVNFKNKNGEAVQLLRNVMLIR